MRLPPLPPAAWQILAAGSLSAVANGLTYPFLVVYLHRVRDLSLGTAGLAAATIAAVVPPEQRADAFAVQFAILNAGIGLGGLTAGLLVDFDRPATFEAAFLAAAACYLVVAAVLPFVAIPPRPAAAPIVKGGGYRVVFRDRRFRLVFALNLVFVGIGDRAARGVSLTEAGRVVLDHADAIARHLAAAEAKLRDLTELRSGTSIAPRQRANSVKPS